MPVVNSAKYYVFDAFDCFGSHDTVAEAAAEMAALVNIEMTGLHMAYMTTEQFDNYCKNGDLKAAFKL